MTAFNSFSSEVFSKDIDCVKVGNNLILIYPIDPFLICYVIKGQSYPALQKFDRFSKAIKTNIEIWNALNNSVKNCTALGINNPPSLGELVQQVFY